MRSPAILLQPPALQARRRATTPWRTTLRRTSPPGTMRPRTTTSWMRLQGNTALTDWSHAVLPTIHIDAATHPSESAGGPGPAEGPSATGADSEIALRRRCRFAPRGRALDSRRTIADQRRGAPAGRETRRARSDHARWPPGTPACPQGPGRAHLVVPSLTGRCDRLVGGNLSRGRALEPAPGRRPLARDSADAPGGRWIGDRHRRRILGAQNFAGRACADRRLRAADARSVE